MHEMSIALNIIDIATEHAKEDHATTIDSIELDVGVLSGILVDSLEFCFDAASRNTLAEKARLVINSIPADGKCNSCGTSFSISQWPDPCPKCNSFLISISSGKDMKITSITIS